MSARETAGLASLALLAALAALVPHSVGAQEIRDQIIPGCGICYPGGYDVNTVGDVRGTVVDIRPPAAGPVRFVVADERERWVVLASPAWYWESVGLRLAPGDSVSVRGSKTLGADGLLYLVAQAVRPPGAAAVVLRDVSGAPLWRGSRRGEGGRACGRR